MLLIHVIARNDRNVFIPKFKGALGITFEIHSSDFIFNPKSRKHLSADFIDKDFPTKGSFLSALLLGGIMIRTSSAEEEHRDF